MSTRCGKTYLTILMEGYGNMAIKLKRGLEATIPTLQEGEPGFTTDSKKLFVGSDAGNIEIGALTLVEVTWQELKDKRDNSLLTPGQQYRITDYECTTTQAGTRSAGHQFDIIVTADDVDKLNENARACLHEGDTYFANSKLEAWQLKYCLDNDTTRFAWAQAEFEGCLLLTSSGPTSTLYAPIETVFEVGTKLYTDKECTILSDLTVYSIDDATGNPTYYQYGGTYVMSPTTILPYSEGKGVIYQMIDEFNNDVPYDFKNIQVYKGGYWRYTFGSIDSIELLRTGNNQGLVERNSSGDVTIDGAVYHCYTLPLIMTGFSTVSIWITDEAFSKTSVYYDIIEGVANVVVISWGYYNLNFTTLYDNSVLFPSGINYRCEENVIERYAETSGRSVLGFNSLGIGCKINVLSRGCRSNTFGDNCVSNTFGVGCESNTFEDGCSNNIFGNGCVSSTFGSNCSNNTFGNNCSNNTFDDYCYYNTFDNDCRYNTFGSNCWNNTFGNKCQYLKISDNSSTQKKHIHVENGTVGASSSNKFDLYDTAILNKNYQVTFKKSKSGKYLMLWATDTGTMTGKYKDSNLDNTWKDIV